MWSRKALLQMWKCWPLSTWLSRAGCKTNTSAASNNWKRSFWASDTLYSSATGFTRNEWNGILLFGWHCCTRVGVNSIISTPTPTPTPEVSTPTPTPTPANLQNINSNSNSGGFNSNSNSNSGKSPEYQLQLQLQLRRFQLQLQFQLRRFQLQFQLQLRSFKSNPNSISNPIKLVQLNYHYPITMWNIVWIKWRYAVDICHVVPNLDQTGQHWHSRW